MYGWRCAQKLGVDTHLNNADDEVWNAFLKGFEEANDWVSEMENSNFLRRSNFLPFYEGFIKDHMISLLPSKPDADITLKELINRRGNNSARHTAVTTGADVSNNFDFSKYSFVNSEWGQNVDYSTLGINSPLPSAGPAPTPFASESGDGNGGSFWSDVLDAVQTILDFAGLIPGAGEVADGINAGIYAARGDGLNAALSAFSAIPFTGWAATGGKLGGKIAKSAKVIPGEKVVGGTVKGAGKSNPNNVKVKVGQQDKHIPGTNNYNQSVASGKNRSILKENPQQLLDEHAGTGYKIPNTNRERVDFGKVIGQYYDDVTGQYTDTTKGIIHYDSKGGAHIVPAKP